MKREVKVGNIHAIHLRTEGREHDSNAAVLRTPRDLGRLWSISPTGLILVPKSGLGRNDAFRQECPKRNSCDSPASATTNVHSPKARRPDLHTGKARGETGLKIRRVHELRCWVPTEQRECGPRQDPNSVQETAAETDRHASQRRRKLERDRGSLNPGESRHKGLAPTGDRNFPDCSFCRRSPSPIRLIETRLRQKYKTTLDAYNARVINDIVFNEPGHIVSVFKDYLIYDDASEFLKRYYAISESNVRLPKIYDYYDKYTRVFPNYNIISEHKLLFKNIERKQRLIDQQQRALAASGKERRGLEIGDPNESIKKMLTTRFLAGVNAPESATQTQIQTQDSMLPSMQLDSKRTPSFSAESAIAQLADVSHNVTIQPNADLPQLLDKLALQDVPIVLPAQVLLNAPAISDKTKTEGSERPLAPPHKGIFISRSISRALRERHNKLKEPGTQAVYKSDQVQTAHRASSVPISLPISTKGTRNPLNLLIEKRPKYTTEKPQVLGTFTTAMIHERRLSSGYNRPNPSGRLSLASPKGNVNVNSVQRSQPCRETGPHNRPMPGPQAEARCVPHSVHATDQLGMGSSRLPESTRAMGQHKRLLSVPLPNLDIQLPIAENEQGSNDTVGRSENLSSRRASAPLHLERQGRMILTPTLETAGVSQNMYGSRSPHLGFIIASKPNPTRVYCLSPQRQLARWPQATSQAVCQVPRSGSPHIVHRAGGHQQVPQVVPSHNERQQGIYSVAPASRNQLLQRPEAISKTGHCLPRPHPL